MKNPKYLLIAGFCLCVTSCLANVSVDWISNIFRHPETGASIITDSLDNSYAAGSGDATYITKRDVYGRAQWQVSHIPVNPLYRENVVRMFMDGQGNLVVVSYQYAPSTQGPSASALIILKYTSDGILIYEKTLAGNFTYQNNNINYTKINAETDADGNIYIATGGQISGSPKEGYNIIKFYPNGNMAWKRTNDFSTGGFYFINNIHISGSLIGVTGCVENFNANASSWVLDSSGREISVSILNGMGGADILFDNTGKIYVLTAIVNAVSFNSASDISLYKINNNGVIQFTRTFDFQGNEYPLKMELSPDSNIVIMGKGDKSLAGIFFTDWLTLKINLTGKKLWIKRYGKATYNNEIPYCLKIDPANNIYLTGLAGFRRDTTTQSTVQTVTLKYNTDGELLWKIKEDSLSGKGLDIALATDSSFFVLGENQSTVIHYFNNEGTDECLVPDGIEILNITSNAATVSWNDAVNASIYHLQYKKFSASEWISISTNENTYTLSGLEPTTAYDYQVESVCNSGPTGYSTPQHFTTLYENYCISQGLNTSAEWIDKVVIGNINNYSGNNGGYADFKSLNTNISIGSPVNITFAAGNNGNASQEAWKVWIDLNNDKNFSDDELVVQNITPGTANLLSTFTVPATANMGATKMRVSMKNTDYSTACEIFGFGEVEDYTVTITAAGSFAESKSKSNSLISQPRLRVSPNPAITTLFINLNGMNGNLNLAVYDVTGRQIINREIDDSGNYSLDVSKLKTGVYILKITGREGTTSVRWIKQ